MFDRRKQIGRKNCNWRRRKNWLKTKLLVEKNHHIFVPKISEKNIVVDPIDGCDNVVDLPSTNEDKVAMT